MDITTFFSYKGGAGRSTTCFNTLPFLAEECGAHKNAPVLLLDMDIESAGMTYLLGQEKFFEGKFDVKELLKGEEVWGIQKQGPITEHPLYKKFVPVGKMLGLEDDYAVMFLGVDDTSEKLDPRKILGTMEEVMSKLSKFAVNHNAVAIVMDSAAGDQFTAKLAVDLSDKIVFCMRPTHQFRIGTFNYLHRLAAKYGKAGRDKTVVLLPTVVPMDAEIEGVSMLSSAVEDIDRRLEDIEYLEVESAFVQKDCFGINEVTRFKWKEGVLYKLSSQGELTPDEKEGYKRYQKLAKILYEW